MDWMPGGKEFCLPLGEGQTLGMSVQSKHCSVTAWPEDGAGTIPLGMVELRCLMHLHLFPI